jgi:hypothetical protein
LIHSTRQIRCGHKTLYAICTRTARVHCLPTVYTDCPRTLYVGVD